MKKTNKIIKKIISLLLIICIICIYMPKNSFATETSSLDLSSISVTKNVTVGDKIKISFRVNNISGDIKYVKAYYSKPIADSKLTDAIDFKYNVQNGLFESEVEVTNTWMNGEYKFNRLFISIGSYLGEYYNSENECINTLGVEVVNLNAFNFTVYGTTGDDFPPYIDSSTLNVSKDRVVNGDTITYQVKIIDNTAIKSATLKLAQEVGRYEYTYKTLNLTYNPTSKLYEAILSIDSSLASGYWYIYNISATDKFYNTYTLYNSRFYSTTSTTNQGSTNLMLATMRNYQEYPDAKLENNSLMVETSRVTKGDNLKISMVVSDDFRIDNIKLYYNQESGTEKMILEPEFEKVKYTMTASSGGVTYSVYTTDQYSTNKIIGEYGYNCNWILDRIEVTNKAGHITTFYNKQAYPYSLTDLSSANFTTYGLTEDSIEVDTENVTLNSDKKTHQIEYDVISHGVASKKANFKSNDESIVLVSPTGLITAQKNGNTTITITSEDNKLNKTINVSVNMNEEKSSISCTFNSNGNDTEPTTIQLIKKDNNTAVFQIEVFEKNKNIIIPSIDNGEYIVKISKDNHITREYAVTINNSNINLETQICLRGDINGDGKVSLKEKFIKIKPK